MPVAKAVGNVASPLKFSNLKTIDRELAGLRIVAMALTYASACDARVRPIASTRGTQKGCVM